jgi:hypothetical protein
VHEQLEQPRCGWDYIYPINMTVIFDYHRLMPTLSTAEAPNLSGYKSHVRQILRLWVPRLPVYPLEAAEVIRNLISTLDSDLLNADDWQWRRIGMCVGT